MPRPNYGVTLSIVLHVAAVLGLSRIAWNVAAPPAEQRPAVVWFGEWGAAPKGGDQRGPDDADSETTDLRAPAGELPPAPAAEPSAPAGIPVDEQQPPRAAAPPAAPPVVPPIDWAEVRRRAIEDTVEDGKRAASYRSFSFPGTIGEEYAFERSERERREAAGEQPARTVFDSPAKGRAGLEEENVLGEYVVWISDDCYQTFGTRNVFVLPSALGLYDAPTTNCVGYEPRDDLFADQKPAHLMSAEEREERQERWRRTGTGAIASFGD